MSGPQTTLVNQMNLHRKHVSWVIHELRNRQRRQRKLKQRWNRVPLWKKRGKIEVGVSWAQILRNESVLDMEKRVPALFICLKIAKVMWKKKEHYACIWFWGRAHLKTMKSWKPVKSIQSWPCVNEIPNSLHRTQMINLWDQMLIPFKPVLNR